MFPGLLLTVVVALSVLYTSLVLSNYCLRHPQLRDVCDLGQKLFWDHPAAWWFTAIMFVLNNTFIQGLHVLVGAKYFNTMTDHNMCTVGFSAITGDVSDNHECVSFLLLLLLHLLLHRQQQRPRRRPLCSTRRGH